MPVADAQYDALLLWAVPSATLYDVDWRISEVRGQALIHARRLMAGEDMIWPDRSLTRVGRWWQSVLKRFRRD